MNRILKTLSLNLVILIALLLLAEGAMFIVGVRSLHQLIPVNARTELAGTKFSDAGVKVFDTFSTGQDAIFRANAQASQQTRRHWAQAGIFINGDGFRGSEFVPSKSESSSVLLIGDSFTWGSTATPITQSFADRLQASGYHVYNCGIPGTDVGQYARVAAVYTPRLRPQVVVLCLYEGNDLAGRPMPVKPDRNLQYVTSIGFIKGYDLFGRYFKDSSEAIAYHRAAVCGRPQTFLEWLHFHTRIGRAVDRLVGGPGPFAGQSPNRQWIRQELLRVAEICRANGSDFVILVIPAVRSPKAYINQKQYLVLLKGLPVFLPDGLVKTDYHLPPDNHFNNEGHRKFADFAQGVLSRRGHLPAVRKAGDEDKRP